MHNGVFPFEQLRLKIAIALKVDLGLMGYIIEKNIQNWNHQLIPQMHNLSHTH